MEHGHGREKRESSFTTDGIVPGMGTYGVGRKEPPKWQTSPPSRTNVVGVVRARPAMWPTAC